MCIAYLLSRSHVVPNILSIKKPIPLTRALQKNKLKIRCSYFSSGKKKSNIIDNNIPPNPISHIYTRIKSIIIYSAKMCMEQDTNIMGSILCILYLFPVFKTCLKNKAIIVLNCNITMH